MSANLVDARARFLAKALTDAGLPAGEAAELCSWLGTLDGNAARIAATRNALRPYSAQQHARRWLEAFGLLSIESCAACGLERGRGKTACVVKGRLLCIPCALGGLEQRA